MTIKTGLYNNYVTCSTHGSSVSSLTRAHQVPERFTMNHQQPSLSSSQCETPGGLTKPSTFCRATSHWSPPSQSVTLPGTWQVPGHRGAFHTTSCPLFQAAVLQHQALKQINKQVQMQPALYNQNLLCSAEGETAAGQSHNKCIKPRFLIPPCTTNCWCVSDFENKQKQPRWTLLRHRRRMSILSLQVDQVFASRTVKSPKTREALQRLTFVLLFPLHLNATFYSGLLWARGWLGGWSNKAQVPLFRCSTVTEWPLMGHFQ